MKKFETKGLRFYELCNEYINKIEEEKSAIANTLSGFDPDQVKEIESFIEQEDSRFEAKVNIEVSSFKSDLVKAGFENEGEAHNWSNEALNGNSEKQLQHAFDTWLRSVNQCLILT